MIKDSTTSIAGGIARYNDRPEEDTFQKHYSYFIVLFLFKKWKVS